MQGKGRLSGMRHPAPQLRPRSASGDCGHNFLIDFSCNGCGVRPSCNARYMAQAAAHLAGLVIPGLPVYQRVLSVPKRQRHFLQHDSKALSAVARASPRAAAMPGSPGNAPLRPRRGHR